MQQWQALDTNSIEYRIKLSKLIMRLFELWELGKEDQLALLGLSTKSGATLDLYRNGEKFSNNTDIIDRAGHLLSIHKSLRILLNDNRKMAYRWITMPNKRFDNKTPLEVIKEKKFEGLLIIRRHLEKELSQ